MTLVPPPPLSQNDIHRLEDEAGIEFVDGRIVEKPVSIESSEVGARVIRFLANEADASGVAEVFDSSLGYKVYPDDPTKFRKPDASVIRVERLAGIDPVDGFMHIPADLVIEVLSPNDLAYDVNEKVEEYLRHKFGLIWVVQPNTRSVAVYRADGSTALLHENDEITGEAAFPGFRCKVSAFFAKSA